MHLPRYKREEWDVAHALHVVHIGGGRTGRNQSARSTRSKSCMSQQKAAGSKRKDVSSGTLTACERQPYSIRCCPPVHAPSRFSLSRLRFPQTRLRMSRHFGLSLTEESVIP